MNVYYANNIILVIGNSAARIMHDWRLCFEFRFRAEKENKSGRKYCK